MARATQARGGRGGVTEPTLTFAQQRKLNLRAKRRRLAFAKLSPFGNKNKLSLPDPPELEGDLAPSLSPWQEEMIDALSDDWYENKATKTAQTRQKARKHPLIPTRAARKKSQEDRTPELRLHATEEKEDGAGNITRFDSFDAHDFNAWHDEIHESQPGSGADDTYVDYTEGDYVRLAKVGYPRRARVDSGHMRIGGDSHVELIDLDVRIAEGDAFGVRLSSIAWARPISQSAEAAVLGVSTRTLRRRRPAGEQEQAA